MTRNGQLNQSIEQLLSAKDDITIGKLPHSMCRNCPGNLRLYKGRWYHVEMAGGHYYRPYANHCDRAYPLRCVKCGARLDYRTVEPMYYHFKCQNCIEEYHKGNKIGDLNPDISRQLKSGNHRYLKFGTSCSVVLTKNGIFFEDIC